MGAANVKGTGKSRPLSTLGRKGKLLGCPAQPVVVDLNDDLYQGNFIPYNASTDGVHGLYAFCDWLPNGESDLAGYHVEMAGSIHGSNKDGAYGIWVYEGHSDWRAARDDPKGTLAWIPTGEVAC